MELEDVEEGETYTVSGHDHVPDDTEVEVVGVHDRYGHEGYHPVRVKYDEVDEEGEFVQEYAARVKAEHLE